MRQRDSHPIDWRITMPYALLGVPRTNTALDRRLVHKRAHAEVLITSVLPAGPDIWRCGVQIPGGHSGVGGVPRRVPVVLAVEVVRQAGLAVSHLGYDVPLDWAFTIQRIAAAWTPGNPPVFAQYDTFETIVTVAVVGVTTRKGLTSGMELVFELGADGRHGSGHAEHRCLSRIDYRSLRRAAPAPGSVAPRTDGERLRAGTITEDGLSALLGWNEPGTPFIFDHPVDHIPGMLLVDAGIAAHRRLTGSDPSGLALDCDRFGELASDVAVQSTRIPDGIRTVFRQEGHLIAEVTTRA